MLKHVQLSIRPLMIQDWPIIHKYAPEFVSEVGLKEFNLEKFELWLWSSWMEFKLGILLALDYEQNDCGAISGLLVTDPFSGDTEVQQTFWYVYNHMRGTDCAVQLDAALAAWGRHQGAKTMTSGHFYNGENNLGRYFRMMGYSPHHISYLKEL